MPSANALTRFDLTGTGSVTDTGIFVTNQNEMSGQVMAFGGDRTGTTLIQSDSGAYFSGTDTISLPPEPTLGTWHVFVQCTTDPLTVAAIGDARIYLGTEEAQSITSGGRGSICQLIYTDPNVWQGFFSGSWTASGSF